MPKKTRPPPRRKRPAAKRPAAKRRPAALRPPAQRRPAAARRQSPPPRGRDTSSPVRIVLKHHHTLSKHGYKDVKSLSDTERHAALLGAMAEFGATYVIRKLNVLAIYNKHSNPDLAALFRRDIAFVQRVRNGRKAA